MKRDDRLTITIPYPSEIPRSRGIHSTNYSRLIIKARCTSIENDLLDAAVEATGVGKSQFVRWAVVFVAREIMRYQDDPTTVYPDYCKVNGSIK